MNELTGLNRLVVMHNPEGTDAASALQQIKLLKDTVSIHGFEMIDVYETKRDVPQSIELLASVFDEQSVIAWFGGDGSKNVGLTASIRQNLSNATLLPAGGNSDDLPHMTYDRRHLYRPDLMLTQGELKELYPIKILALDGETVRESYAFGYFGVGISANSGNRFNDKATRAELNDLETKSFGHVLRLGKEATLTLKELHDSPQLTIVSAESARQSSEVLVTNGEQMAKNLRFPTKLFVPGAEILEVKYSSISSTLRALGRAAIGRGVNLKPGDTKGFQVMCEDGFFLSQSDGEVTQHSSGTTFWLSISDQAIRVISAKG